MAPFGRARNLSCPDQQNPPSAFRFGETTIRTFTDVLDEPWFVAADVCRALEIGNPSQAVARLDEDERALISNEGVGSGTPTGVVSESGLYSLILGSRKPEAKAFKRWVTHEVLPAIRKTGRFAPAAAPALPATYADALRALAAEVEEKEQLRIQNQVMEPKAAFFDAVTASEDTIGMIDAAKLLGTGRNRLMSFLRSNNILRANNTPFQQYLDSGYFRVVESRWENSKGESHLTLSTQVYQRGVEFIRGQLQIAVVVAGGAQ